MKKHLSTSFIDVYSGLPEENQDLMIDSFKAELALLDEKLDVNEIKITKEAINTLIALRNAH